MKHEKTSISAKSMQPQIELLPPSITLRVGRRKLTLSWRARKPLPSLLSTLLRRSWRQVLAPVLRMSVATAAVCGAWQTQALAAAPAPGTLPSGWSVVNGNVTFTQNGNTLNINQLSPQAIANFLTFSIGSDAAVNISQPGAAAAFLAKVTGGDISQIYGKLTAPGTVVLFNPNGIAIGAGGVVDVGRFVATTLNISNDDFLAGKLTFAKDGAVAGSVENYGTITSATGGSVYLIGSSVTNGGIIKSPRGEVILAAGQSVTLADTGTPGVTVNVTGSAGNVTNLGSITAEAGRIGIAAGLITNSGEISASSVVREGGRIFLRASTNLTTTASSNISADGTTGGNIVLNGGDKAYLDGDISAVGTAGTGGYVDTSGHVLDVVKAPKVGSGGTWLIDPYDLTVTTSESNVDPQTLNGQYALVSNDSGATISNATIQNSLDHGSNIILQTGGTSAQAGNITVAAAINKSSGSDATLTLNAHGNISINSSITNTSGGKLGLILHSNLESDNALSNYAVQVNGAQINLGGGALQVIQGSGSGTAGDLNLNTVGGTGSAVTLGSGGSLSARNVIVSDSQNMLSLSGASSVQIAGTLSNRGTIQMSGVSGAQIGTLVNNNGGSINIGGNPSSTITVVNQATNNGTISLNDGANVTLQGGLVNNGVLSNSFVVGTANLNSNGAAVNNGVVSLTGGSCVTVNLGGTGQWTNNNDLTVASNVNVASALTNNGTVTLGANANLALQSGMTNNGTLKTAADLMSTSVIISSAAAVTNTVNGNIMLSGSGGEAHISGSGTWTNQGNISIAGSSGFKMFYEAGTFTNNGTINSNVSGQVLDGVINNGKINVNSGSFASAGSTQNGVLKILADATLALTNPTLTGNFSASGAGSMSWAGTVLLKGAVTLAATAPQLNLNAGSVTISSDGNSAANTLSTYNHVVAGGNTMVLGENLQWNNYGQLEFKGSGNLSMAANATLENKLGGNITVNYLSVYGSGGSKLVNDAGATMNITSINIGETGTYDTELGPVLENYGNLTINSGSLGMRNNAGGRFDVTGCVTANGMTNLGDIQVANNSYLAGLATNNGTVTVGDGASLQSSYSNSYLENNGTLTLSNGSVYYSNFQNNGLLQGNGWFEFGEGRFMNNGTVAPGGDGQVGALYISGAQYQQGATGKLLIDVRGVGDYDRVYVDGSVSVDGTLQTKLLNGYVPNSDASFTPFGTSGYAGGSYFRNVLGDIVTTSGGPAMLKARYNVTLQSEDARAVVLTMATGEDFVSSTGGDWGNASIWGKNYLPTAVDRVIISSGSSVSTAGTDKVDSLTINSGGNLNVSGSLGVSSLTIANGNITATAGSRLNVSESYVQSGGNVTLGNAALSQASGTLSVGNITASNLVLEAQSGNIAQQSGTALHVSTQLLASANTGIALTSSTNQIAALAATNNGAGNISIVNRLNTADASVVTLNGLRTAGGSISVDNTGGMRTAALGSNADFLADLPSNVSASAPAKLAVLGINDTTGKVAANGGSVSLVTHSPLTIGAGGVSATGGISLTAGQIGDPTSVLTVNGVLSATGAVTMLGNSIFLNANAFGSSVTASPTPIYGAGVTPIGLSGSSVSSSLNGSAILQQQNQQTQNLQYTVNNAMSSSDGAGSGGVQQQANGDGQTTGGTAGNFGDESGGKKDGGKKSLPMCT